MGITNMVLRTVYISPSVDDALRDEAFRKRTSKNDLIRQYIELGMEAKRSAKSHKPKELRSSTSTSQTVAAKKATPSKKLASRKTARAVAGSR